jgi:anti-anti-sigma regulatory factor
VRVLNGQRKQENNVTVVVLSGELIDAQCLPKAVGAPAPAMRFVCSQLSRINSVGVKSWVESFAALAEKGIKLCFAELSPGLVEQLNLIRNFIPKGAAIESICVPMMCSKCSAESIYLVKSEAIPKIDFTTHSEKCKKCGSPAVFDDLPEVYFGFIQRS